MQTGYKPQHYLLLYCSTAGISILTLTTPFLQVSIARQVSKKNAKEQITFACGTDMLARVLDLEKPYCDSERYFDGEMCTCHSRELPQCSCKHIMCAVQAMKWCNQHAQLVLCGVVLLFHDKGDHLIKNAVSCHQKVALYQAGKLSVNLHSLGYAKPSSVCCFVWMNPRHPPSWVSSVKRGMSSRVTYSCSTAFAKPPSF